MQPEAVSEYSYESGDWGTLPGEPCRFCRRIGGVHFLISLLAADIQTMRCDHCKRSWEADSASA